MGLGWLVRLAGVAALLVATWLGLTALPRVTGSANVGARLSALQGQTGLDPLDPAQPLLRAEVLGIERSVNGGERARARFTYADGASRTYVFWLANRESPLDGWRYTGFDRVFAPHEELPGLPMADAAVPARLGMPVRMAAVDTLGRTHDGLWWWPETAALTPRSVWSPQGDAVLLGLDDGRGDAELWLVPVEGGAPVRLTEQAAAGQWTPDGRAVVYQTRLDHETANLTLVDRSGRLVWSVPASAQPLSQFATTDEGVLLVRGNALWRMPYSATPGSLPERLRDLPDVRAERWRSGAPPPIAPAPDGDLLAYVCGPDVCLADLEGGEPRRIALGEPGPAIAAHPTPVPPTPVVPPPPPTNPPPGYNHASLGWPIIRLAWSPDGKWLAAARSHHRAQPRLAILDRGGTVLLDVPAEPNGLVDTPQWLPDGSFLLLPAYPENGRRIVAVETATGRPLDLSRPRWDAFFRLSPDGTRLLLINDHGGFWLAPVERIDTRDSTDSGPRRER